MNTDFSNYQNSYNKKIEINKLDNITTNNFNIGTINRASLWSQTMLQCSNLLNMPKTLRGQKKEINALR